MEEKRFDNGFEPDVRDNIECNPETAEVTRNYEEPVQSGETAGGFDFIQPTPIQAQPLYPPREEQTVYSSGANQEKVYYERRDNTSDSNVNANGYSGQQSFREHVQKKEMNVNTKIFLSSAVSGIVGCLLAVILVISFLGVSPMRKNSFGNTTGGGSIHISEGPVVSVTEGDGAVVADIIDAVGPAVVGINCETEYTDWFWGTSVQPSSGSGVIINEEGYVVTNNHVIEGAKEVSVTLISGEVYEAELVGSDARTDLAVIKITDADEKLPYAVIGDSSKLRVGDSVVAIGNPLGEEFAGSATKGIISATNRTVNISEQTLTVLQTDAAINPGNSGGALVNMNGEVIGINTAKIADSSVEGLGFSIPSEEFLPVVSDLMEIGHVTGRPLIGIAGRSITEELSEQYGYPVGVYVVEVTPFSGAEDAGIKNKDVVLEVEGEKVETVDDINEIRDKFKAGDKVKMKIYRMSEDKTLDVEVTLGEDKGNNY